MIWGHISPEPIGCPKLKNISLTLWVIWKTSFWFGRHVLSQKTRELKLYSIFSWWKIKDKRDKFSYETLSQKTRELSHILFYSIFKWQITGPHIIDHSWSFKQHAWINWKNWQSCCLQILLLPYSFIQNMSFESALKLLFVYRTKHL